MKKTVKNFFSTKCRFHFSISTQKVKANANINYNLENDETTVKVNTDGSLTLT